MCNGFQRLVQQLLELVVQNQHEGTTSTTQNVGACTLEEGLGALLSHQLDEAVHGGSVLALCQRTARLHHHTTTDGVEGVRNQTSDSGDELGNQPRLPDGSVLAAIGQHGLHGIEATEESSTVDNNATDGDTEATVQTDGALSLVDLHDAVHHAVELTVSTGLADISSQTGTSEVQGVDEQQGGSTSSTTRSQVASEEHPEANLGRGAHEQLLVLVLELLLANSHHKDDHELD